MSEQSKDILIPNSVLFNKKSNFRGSGKCPLAGREKEINYKNIALLSNYISEKGRILPRRLTGLSSKTHRQIVRAIKLARNLALLPFSAS